MNITLNNIDPVNATITLEVARADYAGEVEKSLKNLRKNANIPGFRRGMAPQSMLQQMYGKSVLVDEVNKLVTNGLLNYIKEQKLNVLGEPLPAEGEQEALDFNKLDDYKFTFDIALAPQIDAKLTKDDKMPYYTIQVTDEMIDRQVESYKSNFGTYNSADVVEEKDMVKGLLIELDENGEAKEDGLRNDDAVLMPSFIKDEAVKAAFIGAQQSTVLVFNPFKAYEGNEAEIASFLKIKKDEIERHTGDFSFEIRDISRYAQAELNQELFDKIYDPGAVTSEEALREKVKESIAAQLNPEGDYKFILDVRNFLIEKAADVQFPDAFLKRWLLASNSDRTPETVETDYPRIIEDLKFHLIKEQLLKENDIQVEQDDIKEYAKRATRVQFAQYGMSNVPDDLLENYAQEMLKKEETVRNLVDKAAEDKLIAVLKEQVTLETKEVTAEEFNKFFEQNTD
ncbi:MAG: trigger factor [Dysgonamonadaceae bacterium]|jgi:trigger factor|nr:trigger factor [Dysgonamonadaceae bacterium]